MTLDKTSSERLSIIRFPLIIGVVFIHAYGSSVSLKDGSTGVGKTGLFSKLIQDFISDGIARVAVPLFFIMSGYLFFLGFKYSIEKYKSKIKGRIKTLVIPFLVWNIVTMLILLMAQSIPSTSVFFSGSKQLIATYSIIDFFNSLLGLKAFPISYQFWFIRDLIVMVCLTPVVCLTLANKNISSMFFVCLFSLWFLNLWPIYIPSIAALFFFYAGAYLGHNKYNLFSIDKHGKIILFIYSLILLMDCLTKGQLFSNYIHKTGVIFGIAAALYLSKSASQNYTVKNSLLKLSSYSFFVFAVHEPTLTIFKKLTYKIFEPTSDLAVTTIYLTMPVMVILFALLIYRVFKILMPKTLNVVCGGR